MGKTISITGNVIGSTIVEGDNNVTKRGGNIESPQVIPDYGQLLKGIDELRKELSTKESEISSIRQILYNLQEGIEKKDTSKIEELRKSLSAFTTNFAGSYLANILSNL